MWAGTLGDINDPFSETMLMQYMKDTEHFYEKETFDRLIWLISGNYTVRGKHPGGVMLFPTGCDYSGITPIARARGGYEATCFSYHQIDQALLKIDLFAHDTMEMLLRLEAATGVELRQVPVDSKEVLELFKVDEDGNVSGCVDLPEFKSDYARELIKLLKPQSFNELVKISALSHGTCVWSENGEILNREQGIGIKDLIATRDDIFDYTLSIGLDRDIAFEIAEAVRKGIVSRGKI